MRSSSGESSLGRQPRPRLDSDKDYMPEVEGSHDDDRGNTRDICRRMRLGTKESVADGKRGAPGGGRKGGKRVGISE